MYEGFNLSTKNSIISLKNNLRGAWLVVQKISIKILNFLVHLQKSFSSSTHWMNKIRMKVKVKCLAIDKKSETFFSNHYGQDGRL